MSPRVKVGDKIRIEITGAFGAIVRAGDILTVSHVLSDLFMTTPGWSFDDTCFDKGLISVVVETTTGAFVEGTPQELSSQDGTVLSVKTDIPEDRIARIERLVEEIHSMLSRVGVNHRGGEVSINSDQIVAEQVGAFIPGIGGGNTK